MPAHTLDAVFFVEGTPDIYLRDGMFHVSYQIGLNARFEVVLPPHAYFKALRTGNACAAKFHAGERNVMDFPQLEDDEAATG